MADLTLTEAATRFAESLKDAPRQAAIAELNRFVRWYGNDRPLGQMRGHDVSLYADVLGPATPETTRKAEHVRSFLLFLKKEGVLQTNLAPHLRLRKSTKATAAMLSYRDQGTVELTSEGIDALRSELESLIALRPGIREEIRHAMLDKDFRENSPLDAAKEKQGHVEARIREIEAMLKRAVVVERGGHHGKVRVGTTVVVTNVGTGAKNRFVIVGPTEANAADGKISSMSPVGKALLDRLEGEEVEVTAPVGIMRFRIEEIVLS
jgi:transcription elongation factor GreA